MSSYGVLIEHFTSKQKICKSKDLSNERGKYLLPDKYGDKTILKREITLKKLQGQLIYEYRRKNKFMEKATEIPAKSSEEIIEEAKKYPLFTFADILLALKAHPDWLEELRKLILTAELLELPKRFEELVQRVAKIEKDVEILKQDVAVLKQDVEILKQDVEILKQDVAVLKQDVAILKSDMAYVKGEVGRLKGKDFEREVREKYYAFFGKILRKSKLIPIPELLPLLEEAEERGVITEEQFDSFLKIDLVIEGQIKATKKPVVLAVEVSFSLYEEDIDRASSRADILAQLLKKEVIPTVVFVEAKNEILQKAEDKGILLIKATY